jgi:DNA-directed RNA polymerase subunit E'/Rpb7
MTSLDIYTTLKMERIIAINPSEINTEFKQNLLNILRNEVEGKCNKEGYIEKGSIDITNYGNLYTEVIRYRGDIRVKVIFTAKVVNPTKDDIIECKIKRYNQFGIMAISGPLNIVIPFDDKHQNTNFNIGQSLKVKIVESELILNSNQINVCATFIDEKTIINLKNKNKNKTVSIVTVNDNIDKTIDKSDEDDEDDEDEGDENIDEGDSDKSNDSDDENNEDSEEDNDVETNNKTDKVGGEPNVIVDEDNEGDTENDNTDTDKSEEDEEEDDEEDD